MTNEWKGEHHIRRKPTREERHANSSSVMSSLAHQRRRSRGEQVPAAAEHAKFTKRVLQGAAQLTEGKGE